MTAKCCSERLDIPMADAAVMEKITHRLKCKELERAIRKELYTMRSVNLDRA